MIGLSLGVSVTFWWNPCGLESLEYPGLSSEHEGHALNGLPIVGGFVEKDGDGLWAPGSTCRSIK